MGYDKVSFRNCYRTKDMHERLLRDYPAYKRSKDPNSQNYARWTIEILQEEFGDYSLSSDKYALMVAPPPPAQPPTLPNVSWDEQFKALLEPTTPIWIK